MAHPFSHDDLENATIWTGYLRQQVELIRAEFALIKSMMENMIYIQKQEIAWVEKISGVASTTICVECGKPKLLHSNVKDIEMQSGFDREINYRFSCSSCHDRIGQLHCLKTGLMDTRKNRFAFAEHESSYDEVPIGAKETLNWDSDMNLKLQETSTGCNQQELKKTVGSVSSFVIIAMVFLWMLSDIFSQSSEIQLEQLHKQLGPVLKWLFPLVELLGFVLFVLAIGTMILVSAEISRLQSAMLIFWIILMLVRSIYSLGALYVSIIGILLIGWHLLIEKQPPNEWEMNKPRSQLNLNTSNIDQFMV